MIKINLGSPGGSDSKESAQTAEDLGSIPGSGRSPGGRHGNPLVSLPAESPGQSSLAGYSLWGHKESDLTEQLSTRKVKITGLDHNRMKFIYIILLLAFYT